MAGLRHFYIDIPAISLEHLLYSLLDSVILGEEVLSKYLKYVLRTNIQEPLIYRSKYKI